MPRGMGDIVPGHGLRRDYKYPQRPHHVYFCECGKQYGRVPEREAQEKHNQHKKGIKRW